MNIWNIVFFVLILLLSVVGIFFAGQEMKIQNDWRKSIAAHEKKIVETEKKLVDVKEGTAPTKKTSEKSYAEMSLTEMTSKVQNLIFERKKAWFGCQPGNLNVEGQTLTAQQLGGDKPATPAEELKPVQLVEVKVMITEPKDDKGAVLPPEGLSGIVYLFDEGPERHGGSFLGRFTVKGIDKTQVGYQVTLIAANELLENEVQAIQKSLRSTWAMYSVVPVDRHEGVFDKLPADELEALVPQREIRKMFENPDRPLKDYDYLLSTEFQRRVELQLNIDLAKKRIEELNAALQKSNEEQEALRKDIDLEKKRVAAMEVQRKAVQDKVNETEATNKTMRDNIALEQQRNDWFVAKIAEYQLKATELIEQKAEAAAQ